MTLRLAADGTWVDDAGPGDAGPGDAGPGDAGPGDAGPGDARPGDAGLGNAWISEAGADAANAAAVLALAGPGGGGNAAANAVAASPDIAAEIAYISGVNTNGSLAARSFWADDSSGGIARKFGGSMAGTASGSITYAFQGYTAAEQATLTEVIALWSAVANVTFIPVSSSAMVTLSRAYNGGAQTSDVYSQVTPGAIGTTTSSFSSIDTATNGFELNGSFTVNNGYGIGSALHELGHVLGLGHAGDYDGAVQPSTQQYSAYDSRLWSIMSYVIPSDSSAKYFYSYPVPGTNWQGVYQSQTWMPLDLLAIQRLYGAATAGPLQGGQVFGFHTNIAASIANFFDFTVNTTPVVTLWDAGGNNTLDLSGFSWSSTVNLNPGTFSSVDNLRNNLGIAFGTRIDSVIGGANDDTFTVNTDSDSIVGGGGYDEVDFSGLRSDFTLSRLGNVVTATGHGVTDTLTDIASLVFSDATVASSTIACFLHGTRITTPRGTVAVEALRIGDAVLTARGRVRPVRWIGRRSYAARFAQGNRHVAPVRIRAGALADGVPCRDLLLSPQHALLLDGALVPAGLLLNGGTIVQEMAVMHDVDYCHVELECHDVILAEGAPAETFIDDDSRGVFHNAAEYAGLYPGVPAPALYCAPRLEDSEHLAAIRRQLAARVRGGAVTSPVAVGPGDGQDCSGYLEHVCRDRVSGWAYDAAQPNEPVALEIVDNGQPIARVLAIRYRPDLEAAGIGTGRHGFDIPIAGGLAPHIRHEIVVRRVRDGAPLPRSPVVLEAAARFDPALEAAVAQAIGAISAQGEHDRVLSFMVAQSERLLQQRADAEGRRADRSAHERFRRRWGPLAGPAVDAAVVADPGLRALVIDECVPRAGRSAGAQAILSHMGGLQALGYAVSFVAADEMQPAPESVAALAASGIACCAAPFYGSVEDVLRRQAGCFDLVYLHRVPVAARYLALARQYGPRARIVFSVADLHHVRLERQAAIEAKPGLLASSRQVKLQECLAAWSADAVITHSQQEAAWLRRAVPAANVHCVTWDVPVRPTAVPSAARQGLAFIGAYDHAPNLDAARWLVETVMPLVWQTRPEIGCMLAGSSMPESIRKLTRPGVVAVGVVEDLAAGVFDRVRLTVAPLRFGAGIKGKVLDSLAAGVPCVMTEIAAEGMVLPPLLQGLVGGSEAALAGLICRMHDDAEANGAAGAAGVAWIRRDFSGEAIVAGLRDAIAVGQPVALRVARES